MYDGQMVQGIKDEAVLSFINSKMPLFSALKEKDEVSARTFLRVFLTACRRRDRNTVKGVLTRVEGMVKLAKPITQPVIPVKPQVKPVEKPNCKGCFGQDCAGCPYYHKTIAF